MYAGVNTPPSNRLIISGNVGIGTTTINNILTIQQTSAIDPIADSWTTYACDRAHKEIISQVNPHNYLNEIKKVELYRWKRKPLVNDSEIPDIEKLTKEEREIKRKELSAKKAQLPKFTTERVG